MQFGLANAMRSLLGLTLLLLVLRAQAGAQTLKPTSTPPPPPLHAVIALTGGPNPNPAVVGNTVRCRWSAGVEGEPAVRSECLTQKASYNWSVVSLLWTPPSGTAIEQSAASVTLESSNSTASTSWKADKAGTWTVTLRVDISYTGTECGGDWNGNASLGATVGVQDFVLHPSPADFTLVEDGAARVLIHKTRSDSYYSINNTTRANQHSQTQDGQVTITAHLPPAGDGSTIYFRVIDPPDASPYQVNTDGDHNHGGALIADSATATLCMINGNDVAAAETTLIISSYSGDNYVVEASGDPTFPEGATQRTPILVGWKRAYLEIDNMYHHGAAVTKEEPVSAGATTTLQVDGTTYADGSARFAVGTEVMFFDAESLNIPGFPAPGTAIMRRVLSMTPTTITVDHIGVSIPEYSGIKIVGDDSGYGASTGLLEAGYGGVTNGSDGGAFIEFVRPIEGGRAIPYRRFPSELDAFYLLSHWNTNYSAANDNNTFQLAIASDLKGTTSGSTTGAVQALYGVTWSDDNMSSVYVDNFSTAFNPITPVRNIPAGVAETVVHELGHQFNLHRDTVAHVDARNVPGHDNINTPPDDKCVMAYDRVRDNNIVDFDEECIRVMRNATDPR